MIALSDYLFWDVDRAAIDPERHAAWLAQRVVEYGPPDASLRGGAIGVESSQGKLAFTRVYCGAGCALTDVSPAMGGIGCIPIFSS